MSKIIIEADSKDVAALILALQEQQAEEERKALKFDVQFDGKSLSIDGLINFKTSI